MLLKKSNAKVKLSYERTLTKGVYMFNDVIIEYLIKGMTLVAMVLKSRIVWQAVYLSVAIFFWRNEVRFGLSKLKKWIFGE